jgi:hypothetical protein
VKRVEVAKPAKFFLHCAVGDADGRRLTWAVDLAISLIRSGSEAAFRTGLQLMRIMMAESSPFHAGFYVDFFAEYVAPAVHPLRALSSQTLVTVARMLKSSMAAGVARNPRLAIHYGPIIFEEIFDKEYDAAPDELARFLKTVLRTNQVGIAHLVPFIADRIAKIFLLRLRTERTAIEAVETTTRRIGMCDWHCHPEKLKVAVASLAQLAPGVPWFVQLLILEFVHTLCFAHVFVIPREILREILDTILVLFAGSDRGELRETAVRVVRLLIPLVWDEFAEFYSERIEKAGNSKIATANAVALLGAVTVSVESPVWLPALFEFVERAHRKEPLYTSMIGAEFADFWHRAGSREIPEIERFRYAFSGGYFA